jgi:hypothetical protein
MKLSTKAWAAHETLRQRLSELRDPRHPGLGKMLLARQLHEDRYLETREELEQTGAYDPLLCDCTVDRVVATSTDEFPDRIIDRLGGYRKQTPRKLWNQPYRLATPYAGVGSVEQIVVESRPKKPYSPRCRTTIIPRDRSGLAPDDLSAVVAQLSQPRFQLVEVTFDFPVQSVVDINLIEQQGVFGKSRARRVGRFPTYASWGNYSGSKLVKAYVREWLRLELEFHGRDLRHHHIDAVADFPTFAQVIPGTHLFFGHIDENRLLRALRRNNLSAGEISAIRRRISELQWSLVHALDFLRKEVGLRNTRLLLEPNQQLNRIIREALDAWALNWQNGRIAARNRP